MPKNFTRNLLYILSNLQSSIWPQNKKYFYVIEYAVSRYPAWFNFNFLADKPIHLICTHSSTYLLYIFGQKMCISAEGQNVNIGSLVGIVEKVISRNRICFLSNLRISHKHIITSRKNVHIFANLAIFRSLSGKKRKGKGVFVQMPNIIRILTWRRECHRQIIMVT